MREDMKKLLCERPRIDRGWRSRAPKHKNTPLEDLPSKQSMSRKRYGTKRLNEYLAPLKRYIQKQVGRRWNDVYSEICQQIKSSNPVDTHILEHVDGYISVKVQRVDVKRSVTGLIEIGQVHNSRYSGCPWPVRHGDLYVDPDDGIIKVAKKLIKDKPKPIPEQNMKVINRDKIAVKEEGIWYTIDLVEYQKAELWQWYTQVEMRERTPDNRISTNGYYRNVKIINGREFPDYLYGRGGRYGEYFEVGTYFGWHWNSKTSMLRQMGRNNLVGHNKSQMNKTLLRQMNLRNDR